MINSAALLLVACVLISSLFMVSPWVCTRAKYVGRIKIKQLLLQLRIFMLQLQFFGNQLRILRNESCFFILQVRKAYRFFRLLRLQREYSRLNDSHFGSQFTPLDAIVQRHQKVDDIFDGAHNPPPPLFLLMTTGHLLTLQTRRPANRPSHQQRR